MTFALGGLLIFSLLGCCVLTLLVAGRKRRRDHSEARFASRRRHVRTALLEGDSEALSACVAEAASDIDAQVDLAVILDAVWPELNAASIERLHAAVRSTGLDAALTRGLASRDPTVRGRAVLLFSRLRWLASTQILAPLLRDPDADVRLTAAAALGAIADADAARALVEALRSESLPAERIIERLGSPWAVPVLLSTMMDESSAAHPRIVHGRSIRAHLSLALGLAADGRAVPALLLLLSTGSVEERVAASRSLGTVGTADAVPHLIQALSDEEWVVRAQAAKSLGTLGATAAIRDLEAGLRDPAWWVRSNSASALRKLGAPGLNALRRALDSDDRFARDRAREALDLAAVDSGALS